MDCQRVAELLPWLMNGTLAAPQQQLVREHLAKCKDCRRELGEMSFAWSVYQQHLPAEALINLAYDKPLIAAERDLFARHLSNCADCTEQLDMVKKSRLLESEPEQEEETSDRPSSPATAAVPRWWWWRRPVTAWQYGALAASLLLVIAAAGWMQSYRRAERLGEDRETQARVLGERLAGLEAENERLRQAEAQLNLREQRSAEEAARLRSEIEQERARLEQERDKISRELAQARGLPGRGPYAPQINVLALDVYPVGLTQRDASPDANELTIPRNVSALTLILNSQSAAEFQSYSIEIVNARGRVVWRASGLRRNSTNDYTISVAADYLAAGRYRIVIYGAGRGRRVEVESYQINVKKP